MGHGVRIGGEAGSVREGDGGEAESRCEAEGDGVPGETAEDVGADGGGGTAGDGALPVGLVEEDGAAAGAELDDAEDEGEVAFHGDVGAVLVAGDGAFERCSLEELVHC